MNMSATTTLFLSMASICFIFMTMRRFIAKKREVIAPAGGRLSRWMLRLKSKEWRRYGLVLAAGKMDRMDTGRRVPGVWNAGGLHHAGGGLLPIA